MTSDELAERKLVASDPRFTAAVGATVWMPGGLTHRFRSLGGPSSTVLLIVTLHHLDEFFRRRDQYLREHDLDILKLDESFVGIIGGTDQTPLLVRGSTTWVTPSNSRSSRPDRRCLRRSTKLPAQRCDLAQRSLFAGPLSTTDAERLLASGRRGAQPGGGVPVPAPVG